MATRTQPTSEPPPAQEWKDMLEELLPPGGKGGVGAAGGLFG
jgi:hypothetical protein